MVYAIWVYLAKYLDIAIWFIISPRFQRCYRKFNPTLLHWATAFFQMVFWRICNLSICRKIFEHCHLVHNFHPVPEMLSKIQSDPSPLGYSVFSNSLGEYAIWVHVEKYLNIAIWFRISSWFQRCYRKFNPTFLHWATAFFQMVLENTQLEFM